MVFWRKKHTRKTNIVDCILIRFLHPFRSQSVVKQKKKSNKR